MFHCSHCDAQYLKWQGRCEQCGKWGTVEAEAGGTATTTKKKHAKGAAPAALLDLGSAKKKPANHAPTGISELDRVLSGGLVPGSVTLLAGEPGIGKSTLVAQLAANISGEKAPAYYVSGEESEGQVLMRFERLELKPKHISFSNTVDMGPILSAAEKLRPSLLIIDSIQTMIAEGVDSTPGAPNAVRAATAQCIGFAKRTGIPVLLIGQVTKDGSVAGPKTLEHLVDTMLVLEGDPQTMYRILRVLKHRFGHTDEIGVFEMTAKGMMAVDNPSARFLEERVPGPGSVITCIMEGTRPFLVEIQALAEKSFYANPVRRTSGFDSSRLQMLLAIISKRAGMNVAGHDIYVNVVGGMKIREQAADLAVCAAIMSSLSEKSPPANSLFLGELGLGGEIRSVPFLEKRLKEAERLGIKKHFSPKSVKSLKELGL
jgi:DNA repair protein RadA/Sms